MGKKQRRTSTKKSSGTSPTTPQSNSDATALTKSKDIEGAKLLYKNALQIIGDNSGEMSDNLQAAIDHLIKGMHLVKGSEEDAKELACRIKHTITDCFQQLAILEDRCLSLKELDLCESLLHSAIKDASTEKEHAICCEALAMFSLLRIENTSNICGTLLIHTKCTLDECAGFVMGVKDVDDKIRELQAACMRYMAESSKYITPDAILRTEVQAQAHPESSQNIRSGRKLYNDGNREHRAENYRAAIIKYKEGLPLVQGQERDAVVLTVKMTKNLILSTVALARQEERDMTKRERDELFVLVRKVLCCKLPEDDVIKLCERAAMLCLQCIEDPSTSPQLLMDSNLRLVEFVSIVRHSTLNGIERHKESCECYQKKALEIVQKRELDCEKMDTDVQIPDIETTDEFGDDSFLYNDYAIPFSVIEECQQLVKDGASGNRALTATIMMYQILKDDQDGKLSSKQIVERNIEAWKEWIAAMNETKSYKGRTNSSDVLSENTDVAVNLHWGTPICLEKTKDNEGTNCLWDGNGCISFVRKSIPSSLHHEACGVRLTDVDFEKLKERITIVDHHCGIPLSKDGHDQEFNHQLPNELGITEAQYNLFCILAGAQHPCYHSSLGKGPLPMISMSVPVHEKRWGNCNRCKAGKIIFCGNSFHPENGTSGYLSNVLIWTPTRLSDCDTSIASCFKNVTDLQVKDKTRFSFRMAKHDDKTDEELRLMAEGCREDCARGGRHCQQNRKELNELTQKLVNAKSSNAQGRARSNLVKAIKVNSISGKKRGKSQQATMLGYMAYINNLDSDLVQSLSSALGVDPITPKLYTNSKTGITSMTPSYEHGRKEGSGMTSVAAGTRKLPKKGTGMTSVAAGTRKSYKCKKMETAVQAKLDDDNLTVLQALRKGGFVFNVPGTKLKADSEVIEETSEKTYKTLYSNFRQMKKRMKKANAK